MCSVNLRIVVERNKELQREGCKEVTVSLKHKVELLVALKVFLLVLCLGHELDPSLLLYAFPKFQGNGLEGRSGSASKAVSLSLYRYPGVHLPHFNDTAMCDRRGK